MNIWFKDFEEYMKTLSAASRYDLRRKFKRVDHHVKIDLEIHDSLSDEALQDVYSLYMQVVDKHEMGFEVLPMDFFRVLPKNMSGRINQILVFNQAQVPFFMILNALNFSV